MKKTVLSKAISFLLSLLLATTLLGGFVCAYIGQTVGDPRRIDEAAAESGYGDTLYGEIRDKWENLFAVSGIPDAEEMLSVLRKDTLMSDIRSYFAGAYQGQLIVDTQALEDALQEKLEAYVAGIEDADPEDLELQKNIRDLVAACADQYRLAVRIPMLHTVLGKVTRIRDLLAVAVAAAALFAVVLAVFLFFLQKPRADALYFGAVATVTDTVLLLGLRIFAGWIRLVDRLPLAQSALRDLAQVYVADLLSVLTRWGIGFAVLSAALLAAYGLTARRHRIPK